MELCEGGAVNQEMRVASRSWKRKGKDSSLDPPERNAVLSDFDSSPIETYDRLPTSRSIRE